MTIYFKGFSTIGRDFHSFRLVDFELVKRDLLNHFSIRRGEKLENPEFGTVIWDVLFDPFTTETKQVIIDDVQTIASSDPRLAFTDITVSEWEHGLQLELEMELIPLHLVETFTLSFNADTATVSES